MKRSIAIIGSGPSALMLAATLPPDHFEVTLYERNKAPGRKFLVAGDGGLNLSHSEALPDMLSKYTPPGFLNNIIQAFSNQDLCDWFLKIGIETYTGSSKRIYPTKGIKPIQVLQAILQYLKERQVKINTDHYWKGWKNEKLIFEHKSQELVVTSDIIVYALGGASWSKTGSDGGWATHFLQAGIEVFPFQASNCVCHVSWPGHFREKEQGKWLKNILLTCGTTSKYGEIVITSEGIEGGAVYALSATVREQLASCGRAIVYMDFKPMLSEAEVLMRLQKGTKSVTAQLKEKINLSEVAVEILKTFLSKEQFTQPELLAGFVKKCPITITATGPIEEAISTVGGIALSEVTTSFELKKLPGHYAIGEMLDWDAPTGGYLLQACFSMGAFLAQELLPKE